MELSWKEMVGIAIPPTIAALASFIVNVLNRKKLNELHVLINSRLTELLTLTAKASYAAGELQQKGLEPKPQPLSPPLPPA